MKKLRVGVIGLGMGRHHVRQFNNHARAEVVAVADIDADRLAAAKEKYGVNAAYADAHEMLKKESLDIVSIATPNKLHKPFAIAALRAGAHVLCEKPMAMNSREAEQMIKAAKEAGKRLMINFSFRFTPSSQALKKEVDSGRFGTFYYGRTVWLRRRGMPKFGGWFGRKALSGGGPLIDLGVHRLDFALWLMGYPQPDWVLASTYNHIASVAAMEQGRQFDVEDMAAAMIRFRNGAALQLEASWASHIKDKEMMETRLLGTEAGLHQYNLNEGYDFDADIFTRKKGVSVDLKPRKPPRGAAPSAPHHLVDCILRNKPHMAGGEEGLTVMKLLDAMYKSARTGKPVHVSPRGA